MKAQTNSKSPQSVDIAAISVALRSLQPRQKTATEMHFAKVYEDIREALGRKVPKNALISALKEHGLTLSPAKFNALLQAEAERRGEVLPSTDPSRSQPTSTVSASA